MDSLRVDYVLQPKAYVKMILHASKHLSVAVNGILVGEKVNQVVEIHDVIPLLHGNVGLAMLLEAGLMMADAHKKESASHKIVGMYYAHSSSKNEDQSFTATKAATDKIRSHFEDACIIQILNNKLDQIKTSFPIQLLLHTGTSWAPDSQSSIQKALKEQNASELLITSLSKQKQNHVYDFCEHLEDCRIDFIQQKIE